MSTMTPEQRAAWTAEAVRVVDRCVVQLLDEFRRSPYAHRVEHSLHVDLYKSLHQQAIFTPEVEIGDTGFTTRLVHKEWPSIESHSIRGDAKRRQSYDIAILHPADVVDGTLAQLTEGRFPAVIAIELGLDYSLKHLEGDLEKLERNKPAHPYVVHLSRKRTSLSPAVEAAIENAHGVQTAFAHLDVDARAFRWKGLFDRSITTVPYGAAPAGGR